MGLGVVYVAVGAAVAAFGVGVISFSLIMPARDWSAGRGRWVTARIVRVEEPVAPKGPPYWFRTAELRVSYELDGNRRSATLKLGRTRSADYTAGQALQVFVPRSDRAQPRTEQEANFPEIRVGLAFALAVLGAAVIYAGVVRILR